MNETMRKFVRGLMVGMVSRGVMPEKAKVLIAYLYNGVQLSPLPKYNKTEYPYYALAYSSVFGATLLVSSVPLVRVWGGYFCIPESTVGKVIAYKHVGDGLHESAEVGPFEINGEYEADGTNTNIVLCAGGSGYNTIYGNYNVYYSSGTLEFTANSTTKTPVYAASYNGIELPPLPTEWDDETKPYITLLKNEREYWLVATVEPPYFDGETVCFTDGMDQDAAWTALANACTWYYYSTGWDFEPNVTNYEYGAYLPMWSNTDILDADGNVYLAASEIIKELK